ncbi:Unknown protein, partial [Striga hermonthica]
HSTKMAKNPIASILEQNKLTGPKFNDWLRNLKIVLQSEKRDYVSDKAPPPPPEDQTSDEYGEYLCHTDDNLQARCYMLASMSNELQRQNELLNNASEILLHLQELYGDRTRQIRYQISKELFRCRMTEGSSVHDHGLKMIALVERLSSLGVIMDNELYVDLMLQSLPSSFDSFVVNFNMHNMETSLPELVNMLKTAESTIKKDKPVLLFGSSFGSKTLKSKKRKGKGKVPNKSNKKANNNKDKNKEKVNPQSNHECYYCGKTGHWKRNCKEYLASLKSSGIYF